MSTSRTDKLTINPGYVVGQLARALASAEQHPDDAVRARSADKVRKWEQVFEGIFGGSLTVGSRTPVAGAPAWATLEVAHGGFATGDLLAGGPRQEHETALEQRLDASGVAPGRTALNLHYLGNVGRDELLEALRTGCFRINVPEEGALPVVAWLIARGATEQARAVLEAIGPFFDRLRFYPVPHPRPLASGTSVRLQPIVKTAEGLRRSRQQQRVLVMNEALTVWAPLFDRAVALFLETVEGLIPTLRTDAEGKLVRRPDGQAVVEGGWPCRNFPRDWAARANTLLDDYARARALHALSRKPERRKENFTLLRGYLARAAADPASLRGRDVGMLRKVLASVVTRHGAPGSERLAVLRAAQRDVGTRPTHGELRSVVLARLSKLPGEEGVPSLDVIGGAVTDEESGRFRIRPGASVPAAILRKVQRSLEAPVEELVERGVIPSGEVLGLVLPQMTSQIRAAGIEDPDLQRLYAAVYAAFRRRRSVLLLNLEHQVRIEELPWVAAMSAFRREGRGAESAARETLRQVALLTMTSFPQTIVPNKLLQELRALAQGSHLDLPLVDELAADIFMGTFSGKFLRAAKDAARLLQGTLYERYYGVPFDAVLALDDAQFAALCSKLAGPDESAKWSVAKNGKIIEQEQILTTHNLATLVLGLGLASDVRADLGELVRACFRWVCREQQQKRSAWQSQLRMVKNTAYAWRQMSFFLSIANAEDAESFLGWALEHFEKQTPPFRARFGPAMRGLSHVMRGGRFDALGLTPDGGRRFLGWTTGRHWVLAPG
jgi:hypothetical protein